MKKFYVKIINAVIIVALIALYAVLFVQALIIHKNDRALIILASLAGIAASGILAVAFHEAGHVLFGKICGFKFVKTKIFCFEIRRSGDKLRIGFVKIGEDPGDTEMAPVTTKNLKIKAILYSLGGILMNAAQMTAQICVLVTVKETPFVYAFIGTPYLVPAYLMIVNLLPVFKGSDGDVAFTLISGGAAGRCALNYYGALAMLYSGVTPANLPSALLYEAGGEDCFSVYISYLKYLNKFLTDENAAFKELDSIILADDLPEELYTQVLCEKLFKAVIVKDDKFIKNNREEAIDRLALNDTPTSFRIQAALSVYDGDYNRARLLISSGLNAVNDYPVKGIAEFERQILTYLQKGI